MRLLENLTRIYKIVLFRIQTDLSFMRASSLTFQSLLSIVPILAVMFGIAKGFGMEKLIENILRKEFHDQDQVISYYIHFGYTLLAEAQGGIIAGIGIIFLLVTIMRLLSNIEDSLNTMWGVKFGRTLVRKASDYLAMILICPILLAASSSITVFVTTNIEKLSSEPGFIEQISPFFLHIIPYIMSTLLFMIAYIILPNTHVRLVSSFWAGLFAGSSYQILQATYILIQLKISNAGAIYGSFAALPLFLMWLYLSWMLFLIGAEIVVIHQERLWDSSILAPYRELTPLEKELTMLACCKASVDSFLQGKPITITNLAKLLKMSERKVTELAEELSEAHLAYKIETADDEYALVPAQNPSALSILEVVTRAAGTNSLTSPLIVCFNDITEKTHAELKNSSLNMLLKDVHTLN